MPTKSSTYVKNSLVPTILTDRNHSPPFCKSIFVRFYTSSRTRRYCRKTQPPDSVKDFTKKHPRHSHFRHLKYHITGMVDHLGSYLDELVSECSQEPLFPWSSPVKVGPPVRAIQTWIPLKSKDGRRQIILDYEGNSVYKERNYWLVLMRPLTVVAMQDHVERADIDYDPAYRGVEDLLSLD